MVLLSSTRQRRWRALSPSSCLLTRHRRILLLRHSFCRLSVFWFSFPPKLPLIPIYGEMRVGGTEVSIRPDESRRHQNKTEMTVRGFITAAGVRVPSSFTLFPLYLPAATTAATATAAASAASAMCCLIYTTRCVTCVCVCSDCMRRVLLLNPPS